MYKIIIFICLFFLCYYNTYSQIEIKGNVIDSESQKTIPFATVFLMKKSVGTATDSVGNYSLKTIPEDIVEDTLVVRSMGYKEKKIPVILYSQKILNISLQPDVKLLQEIVIVSSKDSKAKDILKKVRKTIKDNYVSSTLYYEGFYRETLLENEIAVKMNEASLQLKYSGYPESKLSKKVFNSYWDDYHESSKYKPKPYLSYFAQHWPVFVDDENEVNIIESRVSIDCGSDNGNIPTLGDPLGGPIDLVGMDNLKFGLHFFNKKLEKEYAFGLAEDEIMNDSTICFVINFKPIKPPNCYIHNWSKKIDIPVFEGKIYINKSDYSVVFVECKSVNWLSITGMCQDSHAVSRKGFVPEIIKYSVLYQNTKYGMTLKSVNYKSDHNTGNGVYRWNRELVLSPPREDPSYSAEEFPLISESLRYRTASYNEEYWDRFEKSEKYIKLEDKYKENLERQLPLENQFAFINQKIESIPKPKINTQLYDSILSVDKNGILFDLKTYDLYSSTVLQKLVGYEKKFLKQVKQVIKFQSNENDNPAEEFPKYKIDVDSLFQYHYYELKSDLSYKPIFNLTKENRINFNEEIGELNFTNSFVVYLKERKDSFHKTLKIRHKNEGYLVDSIPNVSYYCILSDTAVMYTATSSTGRSSEVYIHYIGNQVNDRILISERDSNYDIEIKNSASNDYVLISSASKDNNRIWVFDKLRMYLYQIPPHDTAQLKDINHFSGSSIFVVEGGKRIYEIQIQENKVTSELIYTSSDIIDNFHFVNSKLVITEYHLFDMSLKVIDLFEANKVIDIKVGKGYDYIDILRPTKDNTPLKVSVESRIHPRVVYEFDSEKNRLNLFQEDSYSYWASSANYVSEVIYAKSTEGVEVPMLISYDKSVVKDTITACLFETYGAYGVLDYSLFEPEDIVLLKEGFILVRVGVRGTGILGKSWYEEGKKSNKKNSFEDFISCVKHIKAKYNLQSNQVFAKGVSAGGLIMGHMVNNYSDEFGGIILDRPFLDVYNLMVDSTNYLTTLEYTEWGDPNVVNNRDYIYSYSPIQNIRNTIKCNLFMRGSYLDYITPINQVALSAFKYASKLEKDKLNLLKVDFNMGHNIAFNYKRLAEEYGFMKYCIGR